MQVSDAAIEPSMQRTLQDFHPNAVRATPEFTVAPAVAYPTEALAGQRHLHQDVVVLIEEDGQVVAAPGALANSIFDEAIRSALAGTVAQPLTVDGRPQQGYALLRFIFEYVGGVR